MLTSLFPRSHAHYTSVPIVGEFIEGLCVWLHARGYSRNGILRRLEAAAALSRALRRRKVRSLGELTAPALRSYAPPPKLSRDWPPAGRLVRALAQYLEERGEMAPTPTTPTQRRVAEYRRYLERVRGLSAGSLRHYAATITEFLVFLDHDVHPQRLHELRSADIEAFVVKTGRRVSRNTLGHVTAALRSFLRFLAVAGEVPLGLDAHIESPRIWRGERLPRALPWETVRAFLRSIDRSKPKGRRDYAMLLLVATYGLRAGEVAALDLEDVAWRVRQIRVSRPKVGTPHLLPLTDEVGAAIMDYLRRGRPRTPHRRLFLRVIAPLNPAQGSTVCQAFAWWARRAGIRLPALGGVHCLRHAVALHLLQEGAPLKTIGDLLGHRLTRSTGVYLRLQVNDLRDVALPMPPAAVAVGVRP